MRFVIITKMVWMVIVLITAMLETELEMFVTTVRLSTTRNKLILMEMD